MKHLIYLFCAALLCLPCKAQNPEKDYQVCTAAEEAYNAISDKYEQAEKAGTLTDETKAAFENEADSLFENAKAVYADFFKNNINSAFAQKIFSESRWTRRLNTKQLESVVQAVSDTTFAKTGAFRYAADRLFRMKSSLPGNPFTDIISKDVRGNTVKLSTYAGQGKYVLLHFWASWCPDCRKEMPELVKLYAEYKNKNFEMVGYSLDKDRDAWIKGIGDLNITWTQMSDCNFWNSQGAKLYAVQFIPLTILVNPDGIIIERGLDVATLKEKLSSLLK